MATHHLRRVTRPAAATSEAPDIPMLHPLIKADFSWGDQTCTIHAQRKKPGTLRLHQNWFFVRIPDGSFHEVQFHRLRQTLTHPPEFATTICIAQAFEAEFGQTGDHLRRILTACGL